MSRLIIGCGYLGMRVARLWQESGHQVHALTRSPERAAIWREEGLHPVIGDVTFAESLKGLPTAETVLYAVGLDRSAGRSIRGVYVDGLRNVLQALSPETRKIIYISSTGVYGDAGGGWVNEDTPCEPTRENGRACLEAERLLHAHSLGARTVILRLAGIYGPGRIPRQSALLAGEPIDAPESGWLNLIHVDDAAHVVLAAEDRAQPPCCYVVADGTPVERRAYYEELARLICAPSPRFAPAPADSPAADRAADNKRMDSRRMVAELGISLQYPDFRTGLAAIIHG